MTEIAYNNGREDPMPLLTGNRGSIDLAKNAAYQARTKHIDVRHHFLTQHIQGFKIMILHIPSDKMISDYFTKPLFSLKRKFCADGFELEN